MRAHRKYSIMVYWHHKNTHFKCTYSSIKNCWLLPLQWLWQIMNKHSCRVHSCKVWDIFYISCVTCMASVFVVFLICVTCEYPLAFNQATMLKLCDWHTHMHTNTHAQVQLHAHKHNTHTCMQTHKYRTHYYTCIFTYIHIYTVIYSWTNWYLFLCHYWLIDICIHIICPIH